MTLPSWALETMRQALLVSLAMAVVALAGCSDEVPSGDFSGGTSAVTVDGSVEMAEFVPFQSPISDTTMGNAPAGTECVLDDAPPEADPVTGQFKCTQASSTVSLHLMTLPDPSGGTYKSFLLDSTGALTRLEMDDLEPVSNGMYSMNWTADEDHGDYDTVAVFLQKNNDLYEVATASASGGSAFSVSETLSSARVTATWSGSDLTLDVSGLGPYATYTGWLVDITDGVSTHVEAFSVQNGTVEYSADVAIGDYEEFHIHVGPDGATKLNVGIVQIN